jgi:diacylglycerol kinase (ATP)
MDEPNICVIINPNAGSAEQSGHIMKLVAEYPNITGWLTTETGHARDLAGEAIEAGFDIVAAAGGDGTIHEVANGLMQHGGGVRFGLIPLGTGNDLSRTLAIPRDTRDAMALLLAGKTERLDLIRVDSAGTHRYVINAAAGGFSGQVNEVMNAELKSNWGPLAYLLGAVSVAPDLTGYHTTISYDGGPHEVAEAINVIVANGRTVAGGVRVAPLANPQDGLMEVIVIKRGSVLEMATVAARVVAGGYLDSPHVVHRRARRVEIVSEPGMWFNVDGELLTQEPITFEIVPGALDVIVGPDYEAVPPAARGEQVEHE